MSCIGHLAMQLIHASIPSTLANFDKCFKMKTCTGCTAVQYSVSTSTPV